MLHSLVYHGPTALFVLCLFLHSVYRQLLLHQWTLRIAQAGSCVSFLILWINSSWANRFIAMVSMTFYTFPTLKFTYLVWTFLLTSRSVYILVISYCIFPRQGRHRVTETECNRGYHSWSSPSRKWWHRPSCHSSQTPSGKLYLTPPSSSPSTVSHNTLNINPFLKLQLFSSHLTATEHLLGFFFSPEL